MMTLLARVFTTVSVALVMAVVPTHAQEVFPSRPIRLIVPQPPGTGGDIAARVMAERFKQDFGQSVIFEN